MKGGRLDAAAEKRGLCVTARSSEPVTGASWWRELGAGQPSIAKRRPQWARITVRIHEPFLSRVLKNGLDHLRVSAKREAVVTCTISRSYLPFSTELEYISRPRMNIVPICSTTRPGQSCTRRNRDTTGRCYNDARRPLPGRIQSGTRSKSQHAM